MKPTALTSGKNGKILLTVIAAAVAGIMVGGLYFSKGQPAPKTLAVVAHDGEVTLAGRAEVPALHQAAKSDLPLLGRIADLETIPVIDYFTRPTDVNQAVLNILLRWAGVDMVKQDLYGPLIDARTVAFLDKMDLIPPQPQGVVLNAEDSERLNEIWFRVYDQYRLYLLSQVGGATIFDGGVQYDVNRNTMTIPGEIRPEFMAEIQSALQKSRHSGDVIRAFLDYIDRAKGFENLTKAEEDRIMTLKVTPVAAAVTPAP